MFREIKEVSPQIRAEIDKASRGETHLIIDEINNGVSQLWEARKPLEGYIVTRLERTPKNHCELVLAIGVGRGMKDTVEFLLKYCVDNNIDSFRTHVVRRGLIRFYERYGVTVSDFRDNEYILTKEF